MNNEMATILILAIIGIWLFNTPNFQAFWKVVTG